MLDFDIGIGPYGFFLKVLEAVPGVEPWGMMRRQAMAVHSFDFLRLPRTKAS